MTSIKRILAGAAVAAMVGLGSASAASAGVTVLGDVQWVVHGTFDDGGTLTGNFYINQYGFFDFSAPWSLTTSANGPFAGFTYDSADVYPQPAPANAFDIEPSYTQDLHLQFADDLTVPIALNSIIGPESYECVGSYSCGPPPPQGAAGNPSGGIVRYLEADTASFAVGSVPEPGAWAMMIAGMTLLGAGLRLARRKEALAPA